MTHRPWTALLLALAVTALDVEAATAQGAAGAFLAQNARARGVIALPGLQYRVLRSGPASGAHPTRADDITVRYEGRLLSGVVFDASARHADPTTFELKRLIPGWVAALQLMRPGDEWVLFVPPELGYGFTDRGVIPAGSVLVFDVTLIAAAPHSEPSPRTP